MTIYLPREERTMGFLFVLIPIACCLAVPAVLAVAAFVRSRQSNKVKDHPELPEGARHSLPGKEVRK